MKYLWQTFTYLLIHSFKHSFHKHLLSSYYVEYCKHSLGIQWSTDPSWEDRIR